MEEGKEEREGNGSERDERRKDGLPLTAIAHQEKQSGPEKSRSGDCR